MRHENKKGEVEPLTGSAWLSLRRQLRRDNRHVVGPCYDWDLEIGDQVSEHIKYEQLFVVRNNVIKGLPSHHSRHHI